MRDFIFWGERDKLWKFVRDLQGFAVALHLRICNGFCDFSVHLKIYEGDV